jgi:hypothetical protein
MLCMCACECVRVRVWVWSPPRACVKSISSNPGGFPRLLVHVTGHCLLLESGLRRARLPGPPFWNMVPDKTLFSNALYPDELLCHTFSPATASTRTPRTPASRPQYQPAGVLMHHARTMHEPCTTHALEMHHPTTRHDQNQTLSRSKSNSL